MATTAAPLDASPAAIPKRGLLAWYRRYYLLVNVPLLFLLLELALVRIDLVHRWPFNEKDDLAKAFTSYAARPPTPDDTVVLLLGNSATDRGFDPPTIERALGDPHLRIFNFGLKGARLDDQFGLMELVLSRGIKPTHVVLGINQYLIDHKIAVDTLYPWLERRTPYVYFHRSRIRTKLWRWAKSLVGLEKRKKARDSDDIPDGKTPPAAIRMYLDQFDHRGADDYPMVDRIPELIAWLAQRGIQSHIVLLPMAASGTHRVADYDAVIAAIRAKSPPGTLDFTHAPDRFTDDLFYDVGHSNKAGRAVLSQAVLPWLTHELAPHSAGAPAPAPTAPAAAAGAPGTPGTP
jgi:hypothetical protein